MDFIKHDETPLFLLIAHLTAASKIEAPEVLTDVALLCVVRKNHTNVLMHIQGYFRNQLNSRQRVELRDVILHYRDGLLPILAPLTLLKHYMAEYPDRYLMTQNYFDPYPDDLGLRLAVT